MFENDAATEGGKRQFRSATLPRPYRDGEETKFVTSFGLAELPHAIRVLQLVQQHFERMEAESNAGQ